MTDPLAALRDKFRARTAQDLVQFRALIQGELTSRELRHLVHSLAGAAGTFGFPALSEAAGAIDDDYAAGRVPRQSALEQLEHELEAVAAPRL